MSKFLSKQEVINILETLPDLPIVIERDCDTFRSTGIQNIEVRQCRKSKYHFDNWQVYDEYGDGEFAESVIWIS